MEPYNLAASPTVTEIIEKRARPRFKLEVEIRIHSRTRGLLKGYTMDISESGVSAMLRIEVPLREVVELDFTLPFGPVQLYAVVRERNAFRYGFQFLESKFIQDAIAPTCRSLALEHSLFKKTETDANLG